MIPVTHALPKHVELNGSERITSDLGLPCPSHLDSFKYKFEVNIYW